MQTNVSVGVAISFLGHIVAIVDAGNHQDITIAEIEDSIENGTLFQFLEEEIGDEIDLTLWPDEYRTALTNALLDIVLVYRGNERRKFGLENSGLCLLVSWTNEVIFRNVDSDKKIEISFDTYQV